jgi:hypothetical protein
LFAFTAAGDTLTGERACAQGNYLTAATAFREAAGKGDARAQKRLGDLYADGAGVPQSYTEAIKWYCMAAVQGHEPSVARLYALGFAGRPGAYETGNLEAACEPVLHPPPEVEATPRTDKATRGKDVRVTIKRYTTPDDYSSGRYRYYYPFLHRLRSIKRHPIRPHPPVHRPDFPRPPFAMPGPRPH